MLPGRKAREDELKYACIVHAVLLAALPYVASAQNPASPEVLRVTRYADDGNEGSLRFAIEASNRAPGRYRIIANIPPSGGDHPRDPTLEEIGTIVEQRGPKGVKLFDPIIEEKSKTDKKGAFDLRELKADVLTVQANRRRRHPDENHAAEALRLRRILITCDRDYLDERVSHCCIVLPWLSAISVEEPLMRYGTRSNA